MSHALPWREIELTLATAQTSTNDYSEVAVWGTCGHIKLARPRIVELRTGVVVKTKVRARHDEWLIDKGKVLRHGIGCGAVMR